MDVEPIYCAEQIRVPPNLADVIKAYTKEVIRQQPDDILAFSAVYFANLATASKTLKDFQPPSLHQVRDLRIALGDGNEPVMRKRLEDVASQLGIDPGTMQKLLSLPMFATMDHVMPREVLLLLLTMECTSLMSVLQAMFGVFGDIDEAAVNEEMDVIDEAVARGKVAGAALVELLQIFSYQDKHILLKEKVLRELSESLSQVPVLTLDNVLIHPSFSP